ncbi:hypothetical protein [Thermoactinospora rubra]|uniref:hypothetical protein n=1 Tax=Thermoactinospora rubra TaxID=1088767 RepID=UPI000A0F970F|nr:hypothetical protein [Thermoactinospora rubra]
MEDDRRVWPPGGRVPRDDGPEEDDEPWNPRLHRTAGRRIDPQEDSWAALPPSARIYGTPTAPGRSRRGRRSGRRALWALLALVAGAGVVAAVAAAVLRLAEPVRQDATLTDAATGVTVRLPPGWRELAVPPVTGFTSAARDDAGALLMVRPAVGADPASAASQYASLMLQGDRVSVVTDTPATRAVRAEYTDVVNRPAYLRVTLLTRPRGAVLLVGLLQPDEPARRAALDALMDGIRPGP